MGDYIFYNGFDGVIDPVDGAFQEKRGENVIATVIFDPKTCVEIIDDYER